MGGMKSPPPQPAPKITPPAPMPDTTSAQTTEAKRRATEIAMRRAGRASTIMSDGSGSSSGGSNYQGKTLG